jgi:hypothetical protein
MRAVFWIGIILLIVGGASANLGYQERTIALQSSASPEEISLAKLLERGIDGNPNIVLTDFDLCENYVYESDNVRWSGAWIPVVPATHTGEAGMKAAPKVVQALLFTIKAQSEPELVQRFAAPKLPALVVNKIVTLKDDSRKVLEKAYPGTDFTKCFIIQEGREPASDAKWMTMLGGGVLAAVLGLALLGFCLIRLIMRK